eukprot:7564022-Alexandrium_andersonii.AAC.1
MAAAPPPAAEAAPALPMARLPCASIALGLFCGATLFPTPPPAAGVALSTPSNHTRSRSPSRANE